MKGRGRKPDERRYRQVVEWSRAGKTPTWIAEQLGLKRADALIARARAWDKRNRRTDEDRVSDKTLRLIDQVITDGLKVQAEVVKDALASTRDVVAELSMRVRDIAKVQTELARKVQDLAERPAEVVSTVDAEALAAATTPKGRPSSVAPPALWLWIVNECVRQIGMAGVVDQLEVTESLVNMWLRGTTPSSRHRDDLKRLLATIWARDDLFDDVDDLLDARDRLLTAQNAEAT